ncbi:MAG: NAD(P)H-hydrate epimerase [Phycisphaeraceae bacterium]|nr:NAD(P)H-hydrate epimerase [Phycisphaeraceae bacterium]
MARQEPPTERLSPMVRRVTELAGERLLTREQCRQVDQWAMRTLGASGLVLMENAGRGAAEVAMAELGRCSRAGQGEALILCGPGNNGGDGLVIARFLKLQGVEVRVLLTRPADALSPDAGTNLRVFEAMGGMCDVLCGGMTAPGRIDGSLLRQRLSEADLIVDALLGTGFTGNVRAPFDEIIREVNDHAAERGARVLSVDIPSGLEANTAGGAGQTTITAGVTVTFAACKRSFAQPAARAVLGDLYVASIGVPVPGDETLRG